MHVRWAHRIFVLGSVLRPMLVSEDADAHPTPVRQQVPVAQPLFPSCLLSVVPRLLELLDDSEVHSDGCAGQYSVPILKLKLFQGRLNLPSFRIHHSCAGFLLVHFLSALYPYLIF